MRSSPTPPPPPLAPPPPPPPPPPSPILPPPTPHSPSPLSLLTEIVLWPVCLSYDPFTESILLLLMQQMYYHLGRTLVLQPDESQSFVHGGSDHPLLPPGANLYTMREPWSLGDAGDRLTGKLNNVQNAAGLARSSLGLSARLSRLSLSSSNSLP